MKAQFKSIYTILKPALLLAILSLSVIGFSAGAVAAPGDSIPQMAEQVKKVVNVNTADAETLADVLSGVGMKKAQAIIEWREQNGNFATIDDLLDVKGIGEKTLEANRSRIRL